MAVFMEKTTPKGNANSSFPSSQTPDGETALARPGAKSKGPSFNDEHRAHTRTRESVKVLKVKRCARCGENLANTACLRHQRRTFIDIVFEKAVHHCDAQIKHCRDPRTLPRPEARPVAVRPRCQGLRRAPARRPEALTQARRTVDGCPSSAPHCAMYPNVCFTPSPTVHARLLRAESRNTLHSTTNHSHRSDG